MRQSRPDVQYTNSRLCWSGRQKLYLLRSDREHYDAGGPMNEQLRRYIGSDDHRARMVKYGFTRTEIDGVVLRT